MVNDSSKTNEIARLKAPLKYEGAKVFDSQKNQVTCIETISELRYVMEPDVSLLSEDEILQYAPQSKEAAKIRLKRGIGNNSDVMLINNSLPWVLGFYYTSLLGIAIPIIYVGSTLGMFFIILLVIISLIYLYYVFNLKNYAPKKPKAPKSANKKTISTPETKVDDKAAEITSLESLKKYADEVEELKAVFDVKEKVVRDLIEKRFEPPQITYDRFILTIDKCHKLFYNEAESAISITQLAVEHTPRVERELENKIATLKQIIDQIEDLSNELVINISSDSQSSDDIKILIDDMENLVGSVKEY